MNLYATRGGRTTRPFRSGLGATLLTALAITLATHTVKTQGRSPAAEKELDGTLEVQYEDSDSGARLRHFLKTPGGRQELKFAAGQPPDLLTGSRVRVKGTDQSDGTLMLTSGTSVQTMALAASNTFGVQQTIVILINFQNNAVQPYTIATAQDVTFTQTSNYYLENSYQQASLAGTVVGWYTLPITPTSCDTNTWASLADQAATSHGVNLAAYSRKIYGFPQTSLCSWWGLGSVGGNPSRAWINGAYQLRVVGHELGHNFGDYHSHSLPCNGTTCVTNEYGDDRDIMGAMSGHMNAFQKERLGWLNYGSSPSVQTVNTTNNYFIEPMSTATNGGPKALKILRAIDLGGYSSWYYVETRARIGADALVSPGVVVHSEEVPKSNSCFEKDLLLTSAFDSVLDPSQSFTDTALGLTITTITSDTSGALVQVAFGAVVCTKAGPTVSVSPLTQSVQPGGTANYTVSVRNNDSPTCAAAPFNLSSTAPAGWTASLAAASLPSLAPGATANASLSVTSPATATSSASIGIAAVESGSSLATSVNVTVGVSVGTPPPSTLSVSVTVDNSLYATNSTVRLTASVSDGKAGVSGASVAFAVTNPSNSVVTLTGTTNASGLATVSYVVSGKNKQGQYHVQAHATAGSANGTGTADFNE